MQCTPMEFCNFEHCQGFARNSHLFCLWFHALIQNHIKAKYQGRNLQSSQSKTGSTRKTSTLSNASNFSRQNSTTRPSLTKLVSFSPSSEGPDVVFTESSDK